MPQAQDQNAKAGRGIYLVVLDGSKEQNAALFYACTQAKTHGGQIGLLRHYDSPRFSYWGGVRARMHEQLRAEAESILKDSAAQIHSHSGLTSVLFLRQDRLLTVLIEILRTEENLSALILASSSGQQDPGPLITSITRRHLTDLPCPLIIVPGESAGQPSEFSAPGPSAAISSVSTAGKSDTQK